MQVNMKTERRGTLTSYWRTGLISALLVITLACAKTQTSNEGSPQPSPTVDSSRPAINYDRPTNAGPAPAEGDGSYQLASGLMGRNMPYRVVFPDDYKTNPEQRYAVVYLLHGLTGHHNDWTDRSKLAEFALKHRFIIVTPEGDDGWYSDSPAIPADKYESYIVKELIPEIDKRFRTLPGREHRVIAGLSMGGYGALKFGIKFPNMFTLVGSFSGAFVTGQWSESVGGNKLIGKSLDKVYGPPNSESRKKNDLFSLVRALTPDKVRGLPYIYLSCGTEDVFIKTNRDFLALLNEKNVPNQASFTKGGHDWGFWSDQVGQFLEIADSRLKK